MRCLATLSLTLSLLLAGCAAPPPLPDQAYLFHDAAFKAPSEPVGTGDLFTLSPAMQAYLVSSTFRAGIRSRGLERGLFDALYRKGQLKIDYDATTTRPAATTYAAGSGNCLSLVIMTAAFARELGLAVHFQSVVVDETWSREGALYVASTHVNLRLGAAADRRAGGGDGSQMTIDFLPPTDTSGYHVLPLEEEALVAMYMNNRAVEAMVAGRLDDAYWWARGAAAADPASFAVYNTLGVIYQRHGDAPMAERAFRLALERQPKNLMAMHNLATALAAVGKNDEAQALLRRLAQIEPEPAFHFFTLGRAAMERGDYGAAKALFAREVERAPYNDEFHFWLGLSHLFLGETAAARAQMELALKTSRTADGRERYSAKLAHLAHSAAGSGRRTH